MKRKSKFLLVSCGLFAALTAFFMWFEERYATPIPVPSVPGGYYEEAFTLTLSAPEQGRIYYTTDGSLPSSDSTLYTGEIFIQDRSQEPNIYNSIQNLSVDWRYYEPDPTPVSKGTVVRAIYINDIGSESEILTQTYFVGVQPPSRGYTLSLVFQHDALFGEDGIYVTGKEYDHWYLSEGDPEAEPIPNYQKHLEEEVTAEFMDSSEEFLLQQVGLRIQGNASRGKRQKQMILVSRSEYSGSETFDAPLFEGVTTHSVMLKQAVFDAVVADLAKDRAVALQQSVPVRVYLNGEYWNDTFLLERYDKQYFLDHYGADTRIFVKDAVVADFPLTGREQDAFYEYLDWFETANLTDNRDWQQFLRENDLQSYIDYIVINYYLGNVDLSNWHNHLLWRDPGGSDRRWKWCIYDLNILDTFFGTDFLGHLSTPAEINTFRDPTYCMEDLNVIYRALKQNPDFCRQFVLSFMDMLNNNFAPSHVQPILEKFGYDLDFKDSYFLKRPKYAVRHLAEEFDLTGTLETVSVSTSTPEMGSVTINTSTIDLSDCSWSGQYFTDYPITITAVPNPGYRFVGWRGSVQDTSGSLTLPVDGGLMLEAAFAPI